MKFQSRKKDIEIKQLFNLLWFMAFDAREQYGSTEYLFQLFLDENPPKGNTDKKNILAVINELGTFEILEILSDHNEEDIEEYLKDYENINNWKKIVSSGNHLLESAKLNLSTLSLDDLDKLSDEELEILANLDL